jgi:hypothetical protein
VLHCRGALWVQGDWATVQCLPADAAASSGHSMAVNALTQELLPHAEIFLSYTSAALPQLSMSDSPRAGRGSLKADDVLTDFMGNRYPAELFCNQAYRTLTRPKRISKHLTP